MNAQGKRVHAFEQILARLAHDVERCQGERLLQRRTVLRGCRAMLMAMHGGGDIERAEAMLAEEVFFGGKS